MKVNRVIKSVDTSLDSNNSCNSVKVELSTGEVLIFEAIYRYGILHSFKRDEYSVSIDEIFEVQKSFLADKGLESSLRMNVESPVGLDIYEAEDFYKEASCFVYGLCITDEEYGSIFVEQD